MENRSTIKNLHIISVNAESGEIEISGQIPGNPGSLVSIRKIKSGSLKELEHEVVAQVVEGEAPAGEAEAGVEGGKPAEAPRRKLLPRKKQKRQNRIKNNYDKSTTFTSKGTKTAETALAKRI